MLKHKHLYISIKAHLVALMDERDKRYEQRFQTQDEKLLAMEKFQQSFSEQTAHLMPRTEYKNAHENLEVRLGTIADRLNNLEGVKRGSANTWGIIIAVVGVASGLVIGILTILVMHTGK